MKGITAVPEELGSGTQASAMTTLGTIAGAGGLLTPRAASSAIGCLSSLSTAIADSTTPAGRRRLAFLEPSREPQTAPPKWMAVAAHRRSLQQVPAPVPKPATTAPPARPAPWGAPSTQPPKKVVAAPSAPAAVSTKGATVNAASAAPPAQAFQRRSVAEELSAVGAPPASPAPGSPAASPPGVSAPPVDILAVDAPASSAQSPPIPPPPFQPNSLAESVVNVAESVHLSMQQSFSVPGEQAVSISTDTIHLTTSLDALGKGSRLFEGSTLSAPGASFDALPPDLFDGLISTDADSTKPKGVQTQFMAFTGMNPWDTSGAGSEVDGAQIAPALVRLKFSTPDGGELPVSGRTTPIRFTLPAPPSASGDAPVCTFYDPVARIFRGDGCAAMPARLPVGHSASWAELGVPPPAAVAAGLALPPNDDGTPQLQDPLPPLSVDGMCPTAESAASRPGVNCRAQPDAEAISFMNVTGAEAAARQLPVAFDFTGELFCGCQFTILDCAEEQRRVALAVTAAVGAGATAAEATAEGEAIRRKVYPSPREALLIPSIGCGPGSTAVMKVFYGEACGAWRTEAPANPYNCTWDNDRQTWAGPCCEAAEPQAACQCLHLTGAHDRAPRIWALEEDCLS